jgi:hypothetical protein
MELTAMCDKYFDEEYSAYTWFASFPLFGRTGTSPNSFVTEIKETEIYFANRMRRRAIIKKKTEREDS